MVRIYFLHRFQPALHYFNMAEHPLCLPQAVVDDREQSECASSFADENEILCTGPGCNQPVKFSTTNLNRLTIGNCSSEVANGCPVELFYRVKVGNGLSPLTPLAPMRIWVENKIQSETSISAPPIYSGFKLGERELFKNVQPIQLVDVDTDVKNIEFLIDAPAARENAIFSILQEHLILTPNDVHSMERSPCLGTGCLGLVTMIGTQSKINTLLRELAIQLEPNDADLSAAAATTLVLRLETVSPFRVFSSATTSYEITVQFGEPV